MIEQVKEMAESLGFHLYNDPQFLEGRQPK